MRKIALLLVAVIAIVCGVLFLAATELGLRFLVRGVERILPETVRVENVSGRLLSAWQLDGIQVTTPDAAVTVRSLSSAWHPTALFHKKLHFSHISVADVVVSLKRQDDALAVESSGSQLPEVALPFALLLEKITVENLSVRAADERQVAQIEQLTMRLDGDRHRFTLADFSLQALDYGLQLHGVLLTERSWTADVLGNWRYSGDATNPLSGTLSVSGPLSKLVLQLAMNQPAAMRLEAVVQNLPQEPQWQAKLAVPPMQLTAINGEWLPVEISFESEMAGGPSNYRGNVTGRGGYGKYRDIELASEVEGDTAGFSVRSFTVVMPEGKIEVPVGRVSWQEKLQWTARLLVEQLDLAVLAEGYTGTVSAELNSEGRFTDDAFSGYAEVGALHGTLNGYPFEGQGILRGTENDILLEDVHLKSGDTRFQATGKVEALQGLVSWQEELQWQATVKLEQFDPAILHADYYGHLNTTLISKGRRSGNDLEGYVDISLLEGTLRGYPVTGSGLVRVDQGQIGLENILLRSGNSGFYADGRVGEELDIMVALSSRNLGEVLEEVAGAVELQGRIEGSREIPRLDFDLAVDGLIFQDLAVERLEARFLGDMREGSVVDATAEGTGLAYGTIAADSLSVRLNGSTDNHKLVLLGKSAVGNVNLQGEGKIVDGRWLGELRNFSVDMPTYGHWRQQRPASVSIAEDALDIAEFCLFAGTEKLCLAGGWLQEGGRWHVSADLDDLLLSRLNDLDLLAEPLQGRVGGSMSAAGDSVSVLSAEARVEIENGILGRKQQDGEWEQLALHKGILDLHLAETRLQAELKADFAESSRVHMAAAVDDIGAFDGDFAALPVHGEVQIQIADLAFIAPLTYYTVLPSGTLGGTLGLSGSLGKPVLLGDLILADGKIDLPHSGITLTEVGLSVAATGEEIEIRAEANSGPGWLLANGSLTYEADSGIRGDFQLWGEDFDTLRLPEYEIRTSPDVRMVFHSVGGELTGRLRVPHAVITPEKMQDSLTLSEDVIYVDSGVEQKVEGWQMTTSLKVELGDDVWLDGYGLTGYLRGTLLVENKPDEYMTGRGELSLYDGKFSIYGRSLDITRGRVLFGDGPIDNPGIDARAEKTVDDDTVSGSGWTVGVDVSGTAQDLDFKLFSDPYLDESDILAYMVVGRSMSDTGEGEGSLLTEAASALGLEGSAALVDNLTSLLPVDEMHLEGTGMGDDDISLVVGKRITDDLFLGYDHNFFDQKGEIKVRYNLGHGFSIETRSSTSVTGADLFYSFEK